MRKLITLASLVALSMVGCTNEEPKGVANEKGAVNFDLTISNEVDVTRAEGHYVECTTPDDDAFTLKIQGEGSLRECTFAEFAEDNYLHYGSYTVTAVAGDVAEEGYDKVAFEGSADFEVKVRENTEVAITATIANALVKVETTEKFRNYFVGGHTMELTTEAGNTFDVSEQIDTLFVAPGEIVINATATKQANQSGAEGAVITLPEQKVNVAAQTFYTIKFDVADAGRATLEIKLNETLVESIDIEQELNDNAENA